MSLSSSVFAVVALIMSFVFLFISFSAIFLLYLLYSIFQKSNDHKKADTASIKIFIFAHSISHSACFRDIILLGIRRNQTTVEPPNKGHPRGQAFWPL